MPTWIHRSSHVVGIVVIKLRHLLLLMLQQLLLVILLLLNCCVGLHYSGIFVLHLDEGIKAALLPMLWSKRDLMIGCRDAKCKKQGIMRDVDPDEELSSLQGNTSDD